MLPFSVGEFFAVFRQYNDAVWPAQIILVTLGVVGVGLTMRRRQRDHFWVSVILAALWLWMAVLYHVVFFQAVNPAALLFGAVFAVQSILLAHSAARTERTSAVNAGSRWNAAIAATLVAYALVGYPLLGWVVGHRYPASPTFGVPCPTTIYTLGVLLWWGAATPWWLFVIPIVWAAVGTSAALQLGVPEDWGLPVAAVVAIATVALGRRRDPTPVAVPRPAR